MTVTELAQVYWSDAIVSLEPMDGPGTHAQGRATRGSWCQPAFRVKLANSPRIH